jgi:hypothetical protein
MLRAVLLTMMDRQQGYFIDADQFISYSVDGKVQCY